MTPRFALVVIAGLASFLALGVVVAVGPQYVEDGLGGGSVSVLPSGAVDSAEHPGP